MLTTILNIIALAFVVLSVALWVTDQFPDVFITLAISGILPFIGSVQSQTRKDKVEN
jgi:hypothetical protein